MDKVRWTVWISSEMKKKAKAMASLRGISIGEFLEGLIALEENHQEDMALVHEQRKAGWFDDMQKAIDALDPTDTASSRLRELLRDKTPPIDPGMRKEQTADPEMSEEDQEAYDAEVRLLSPNIDELGDDDGES